MGEFYADMGHEGYSHFEWKSCGIDFLMVRQYC